MSHSKNTAASYNTSDIIPAALRTSDSEQSHSNDPEKQAEDHTEAPEKASAFKSLGLLDRFLALWIFLAMLVGILLGNFVPNTGPALQKGKFVGVSIPIANLSSQVLIWTGLAGGDNQYCAILVAINSVLQMILYAPLAILFISVIGHSSAGIDVSYSTVATSVAVFLGIPLGAAIITRISIRYSIGPKWYDEVFLKWLSPWSLIGLLFTILVLFASQGHRVVHQIVSVARVAAPLIVYFAVVFFFTLLVTHKLGFGYKLSATQSFTAASNNFELAIAVAVATFGANSDQALASTVGPLIEVPVLLALVYVVKWIGKKRQWED
ncbi:MAG: hypothetical protein Q9179_003733 [Wetmoreana sp. 5 TL-2023]